MSEAPKFFRQLQYVVAKVYFIYRLARESPARQSRNNITILTQIHPAHERDYKES